MRFPGFTEEWEVKKLGEITELITKGTTPKKFVSTGIKFIKIECFNGDKIEAKKCLFIDSHIHNKELKRSILKENDILFAIAGATIGKVNIIEKEILPANTNQALAIIRLKEKENALFIYQILKSDIMQKYIKDSISVGAQPNLNLEQINNFSFLNTTYSEQNKIANFLSLIDNRITTQRKIIKNLESLMVGFREKIFLQKLRFKDDNGNDFPEWEVKKLGDITKIRTGKLDANAMVENGEYRFYTCAKEYYQIDKYAFDTEALLISGNGANVGYIHYFKGKFNAYQRTYVLDEFEENITFIKFFLDSFLQTRIYSEKKEGNTPYIVLSTLSEMEIKIPSLEEQTKIANFLSFIDKKNETEKKILVQYETQKKYLLSNLFI